MPDVVTNKLIYDVLQAMQGQLAALRDDVRDLKPRLTAVEVAVGNLAATEANHYGSTAVRLDRIETRLDRIEKRLELTEA